MPITEAHPEASSAGSAHTGSTTLAPEVLQAINPATRERIGSVGSTSLAHIGPIVAHAQVAGRAWGALPSGQRAVMLVRLRELIAQQTHEIAETIARGMGKPLIEALSFEVSPVIDALDAFLALVRAAPSAGPAGEPVAAPATSPADPMRDSTALFGHTSGSVVCVIAPVSLPFERAMTPAVAALAAGKAVIVKSTSSAPLVGVLIERLFDEAFAEFPGIAQVVHGAGEFGSQLAAAEGVDFVYFTGSASVGRKLQAVLAPLQRPALLLTGGAVALIVCDDADLERAAGAAVFGRFSNNGQGCVSVNRVYVQRAIADAFVHKVVHKVRALKRGPYTDPYCEIGPLANGRDLENLRVVLQDALDKRAVLVAGGFPAHVTGRNNGERLGADRQGWFWPPTVLLEVDHSMRVMKEAIFGPILPIRVVEDDREAIALANDTVDGFGVCVFSDSVLRAEQIAAQLKAGRLFVNDLPESKAMPALYFSGTQQSDVDDQQECGDPGNDPDRSRPRRSGVPEGLPFDDRNADRERHRFPYSAARLRAIERALAERSA